jgi:CarboxypepD_reg-like domain/TonB-dependent Receptor Plug Domain
MVLVEFWCYKFCSFMSTPKHSVRQPVPGRLKFFITLFLWILPGIVALELSAQNNAQQVKGTIIDKASERPLANVSVNIPGTGITAITDSSGRYVLRNVPLGRQKISFSSVGYNSVIIPEVLVSSGKEVVVEIALEQLITSLQEITMKSTMPGKGKAVNEYAGSSSRSFSMEEITRYAGGRNDPARLASNFAGVATTDDSRNDIVVRGNSPTGVLWRMEGIPIPNPNHFSSFGTTGGPVSAINTNALKTSDFYTGAFPAEFGNATAAVFDISLRPGNKDKFENTIQLNLFSGLEALAEGPIGKKSGSSFLIGYRYSFARIAQSIGFNIGTAAVPAYQDLTFNIDFKKGKQESSTCLVWRASALLIL